MAFNNRISSFGSNDSGFESGIVEVFDEPSRPATKNTDQVKDLARQQQHRMASQMSIRDADDYQQDMLEHMLKIDVSSLIMPLSRSELTNLYRLRQFLMSMQLTFKLRFNGT